MKKFLVLLALLFTTNNAYALNKCNVYYPANEKIVNTSYSSGGGSGSSMLYLEMDVVDKNDNYKKYIVKYVSAASIIGMGRYTMPSHIYFIRKRSFNNTVKMECK